MPTRRRRLLAGLAVLGGLAMFALLALYIEEQGQTQQREATRPLPELVRGADRTEYGVCVAGAGGLTATADQVKLVESALLKAMTRIPGIPYAVTEGCEPPAGLTGERLGPDERDSIARIVEPPATPSPYTVAVYFIPDAVYDAAFEFAVPYAVTTEEMVCKKDVCGGVTGGVYVTPDVAEEDLTYAFLDIEGLEPGPVDACYGQRVTQRPEWCAELYEEAGETPLSPAAVTPVERE